MAQQTSVEWYAEQLEIYEEKALIREITIMQLNTKKQELIKQAKENHKEEIVHARMIGDYLCDTINAENYYNQTFNQ